MLQYSFAIKSTKLILELDIVPEMKNHRTTAGGRGARRRRKKRRKMLQSNYEQNNDQDFAVTIREGIDEPVLYQSDNMQGGHNPSPAQARPVPSRVYSPAQARPVPNRVHSFPNKHMLREIQMRRSGSFPEECDRYQTEVEEPNLRHSKEIVTFEHLNNIGQVKHSGNEKHLMTLMLSQMKNMKEQIINLKSEQIKTMKRQEQMQNALGKIKEHKEKLLYCFHCNMYSGEVHFCTEEQQWIHLDRFNRITIYSDTIEGATPRQENDLLVGNFKPCVIRMDKFTIDERETIVREKKKKKAEMEEQQEIKKDAQRLTQIMNKIFGESSNLEITKDLHKDLNLSLYKTEDEGTRKKWKKSHDLPNTPRKILSSEQEFEEFCWLCTKNKKILDKHNEMARERQEETKREKQKQRERERQEEEQHEEICKQQEQIRQIRRRQNYAFEENFRMMNLYHN